MHLSKKHKKQSKITNRAINKTLLAIKKHMKTILIISVIAMIFILIFAFQGKIKKFIGRQLDSENQKNCPSKILGNTSSAVRVAYFETPYCPACWKEELFAFLPLFKKMGNSFYMEKYDIRYCRDLVRKYRVIGTPTFVFQNTNTKKEYVHFGYLSYSQLKKTINGIAN